MERDHRAAEQLDDLETAPRCAGAVDAAAGDDERALGAGEQRGGLRRAARRDGCGAARCDTQRAAAPARSAVAGRVQDRRRQLELHRARASAPHLAERQAHHLGDALPLEDGPPHFTAGRKTSSWSWPWNVEGGDG